MPELLFGYWLTVYLVLEAEKVIPFSLQDNSVLLLLFFNTNESCMVRPGCIEKVHWVNFVFMMTLIKHGRMVERAEQNKKTVVNYRTFQTRRPSYTQ